MSWSPIFIIFNLCFLFYYVDGENSCGDWEPYREEKCFRVIENANTQSFSDATKTCATYNSRMITIGSKNEQTFLENYLFNKKAIVDNVWLGGKNDSVYSNQRVYRWQDGSNLTFTNWENGYPKDRSVDSCIQMNSDKEVQGKWTNEPCARKNLVVCEKKQTWSLEKIQTLLVQTMQNQVPLGFIYVQLPYEKSPQEIWSGMTWTDISYIFDGVFFRVASGKAASFGTVQEEFSPYIDEIKYEYIWDSVDAPHYVKIPRTGGWSGKIENALINSGNGREYRGYHNFHFAAGEVRPKNMAVKIWKRTY